MEEFDSILFRCNREEKQRFMKECEQMEISGSVMLRRLIHLYLTDKVVRNAALNFNDKIHRYSEEF